MDSSGNLMRCVEDYRVAVLGSGESEEERGGMLGDWRGERGDGIAGWGREGMMGGINLDGNCLQKRSRASWLLPSVRRWESKHFRCWRRGMEDGDKSG